MIQFNIFALIGFLSSVFILASGSKCPRESIARSVLCYYENERPLRSLNICNCTHVIFTNAVRKTEGLTLDIDEGTKKDLLFIKENKKDLLAIFTLATKPEDSSAILKSENKTVHLIREISNFLRLTPFDGIELDFNFNSQDGVSKDSYASFVKDLAKVLSSDHERIKRDGYDVFEKVQDDITTVAYSTQRPRNSTSKTQSIRQKVVTTTTTTTTTKTTKINRKTRDDQSGVSQEKSNATTLEDIENEKVSKREKANPKKSNDRTEGRSFLVFVRLSIQPEVIAKKFDLKAISRYADMMTVPTHNIVNKNEAHQTYHPSRLMGLSDILNTDSILDFLTGMGALKSKLVISIPATVLEFKLDDANKNTPRSPSSDPRRVDQSQLCLMLSKGNWTLERDEDLTAPYAFSGKTWLAFEDEISVNIKSKYILLRELAGGAIYSIDADVNDKSCANGTETGGNLAGVLYRNFKSLERKPRALVLESLQEEIHDTSFAGIEAGVKLSEYRIVRVVDHSGAVHVIRKNTKTQFECTRQGYFSHPLGCNKFYRCVKFDQYSDEFTVFEYNCPAGLAFDERWEVCVWPGSLPHGAPCTGSSEIAPVPRSHYQCPNQEGYYADPENCRWFFACLDHARDGITPLTAYEFRCPFGLVFNEIKLACDWPWLVGACGNRGGSGYIVANAGGSSSGISTFINGGNLETSFGQYGNAEQESSFNSFGRGFGSVLKGAGARSQSSYQGSQSAGFGYIASPYDDNQNRASFGSLPDYEISGGRILNKGGVVLDQTINVGSGIDSNAGKVYFNEGNYGQQNIYVESSRGGDLRTSTGFGNGQNIELQKLNTISLIPKTTIVESAEGYTKTGEASFQHPISTPKPFLVNIPSVQTNEGRSYEYSQQTFGKSSTPQTLAGLQFSHSGNEQISDGKYYNVGDEKYTVTQDFSVTKAPAFGQNVISGGISLSTPATPVTVPVITSKIESSRFGQSTFGQSGISTGVNINQPSVLVGVSVGTSSSNQGLQNNGGALETLSAGYPATAVHTARPVTSTFEYTSHGHSGGQSVSQPAVSLVTSGVDLTKQTGIVGSGKVFVGQPTISVEIPRVTPTTPVHIFEGGNSGQGLLSENVATHQSSISFDSSTSKSPLYSKDSFQFNVGVSTAAPKVTIQSFKQASASRDFGYTPRPTVSYKVPDVTPKTFYTSDRSEYESNGDSGYIAIGQQAVSNSFPSVTPKSEIHSFSQGAVDSTSFLEGSTFGGKNTPTYKYHGIQSEGLSVNTPSVSVQFPTVTAKPIELSTPSGLSGQAFEGFSGGSYEVPVVTPRPKIYNFDEKSSFQSTVQPQITYNIAVDNSKPESNVGQVVASQGYVKTNGGYSGPLQPTFGQQFSYSSSFKQSGGRSSTPRPFGFETVTQTPESVVFDQPEAVLTFGDKPKISTQVTVEPQPIVSVGTISSYQPETSTPKTVFPQYLPPSGTTYQNIKFKSGLTQARPHITVSTPAPVVSVTSSTPGLYDQSQSTPNSFNFEQTLSLQPISGISTPSSVTEQTFSNLPKVTHFDQKLVKSTFYSQPTLQKGFTPTFGVTSRPFGSYQQSVSTVTPSPISPQQNNFYLPPVTPKIEVFKPKIQQTVHVTPSVTTYTKSVGNVNEGQIELQQEPLQPVVNQNFEFLKTKPVVYNTQQNVENIEYQVPVQGSTFGPEYREPITLRPLGSAAVKPCDNRDELLQISKSLDLTPNNGFRPGGQVVSFQQSTTAKPIVVQQQPVQLISQNKFKNNQIIQPFYKQSSSFGGDKRIYQTEVNPVPEIGQELHVFQQEVTVQTPKTTYHEQKQYLPPVVTPKTYVSTTNPSTVSESSGYYLENRNENITPLLPVVDTSIASDITISGQKEKLLTKIQGSGYLPPVEIKKPAKTVYTERFEVNPQISVTQQEINSPKVNLLLPVTTETPQEYYSPLTEDVSIQHHTNFEFQKVDKVSDSGSPNQNVFIQPETYSTPRPVVSAFDTSKQFEFGGNQNVAGGYQSGVQYSINPKVEIPEPPKEYLPSQDVYSTERPDYSTRNPIQYNIGNQISSTSTQASVEGFKTPGYLPPKGSYSVKSSRRRPSKTTIISAGNVDEHELRDDNIQQLLEKYSGEFGQVLNEDRGKFVTKIVKGEGKSRIDFGKEPSSTIRYEVTSSRSKQRGKGRQYHGSLTSNLRATNKYEEYEIEGDQESQRSIDLGNNGGQDGTDSSKTTLDLKNLKLDKNKKTVIVVSQVSDANPILIGKLAGQCSCQSNKLELRNKGRKPSSLKYDNSDSQNYPELQQQQLQPQSTISKEYIPEYRGNQGDSVAVEAITHDGLLGSVEVTPETVLIGGRKPSSQGVPVEVGQSVGTTTTVAYSQDDSPSILSSLSPDGVLPITPKTLFSDERLRNKKKIFRGRTRYLPPVSTFGDKYAGDGSLVPLLSPVPASEIASTVDYAVLKGDESRTQNEIDGGSSIQGKSKTYAGAAFDRYGPGGWRSYDETLQGSVDCKRPGLFRHPKYCNKFYACNYDPWKERYTLHVFNCPIHLTYDSSISACNWPVRGPACADDNLLV